MTLFPVVFGLALLLLLLGLGAGLAERWASERGRAQVPWILATLGAGALGYGLCVLFVLRVLELPSAGAGAVMAGVVVAPLSATLLQGLVLLALRRAPPAVPTLRGDSFAVSWMERGRDWEEARLKIASDRLRLEGHDVREIPLSQIEALEPEGESLRLRWAMGELVLLPEVAETGEARYEAAARQSEALARRIARAREAAAPPGPEHPYRS
jgi:hypothetical protein